MPVPVTVGFRALFAGLALWGYGRLTGLQFKIAKTDRWTILGAGVLMGIHWLTYFYALHLSNVAIGMLSLFTYPIMTAVMQPLLSGTKVQRFHLLLGGAILVGIFLLVPEFDLQNTYVQGVAMGLFSAFCYSLRNIILQTKVHRYHGSVLMLFQMLVISLLLSPVFFLLDTSSLGTYLPAVLTLAILTTALGHSLFLYSFRHFSVVSASIISCLQPVYGIILGAIFLREYPEWNTYVGGAIILLAVIAESLRVQRKRKSFSQSKA